MLNLRIVAGFFAIVSCAVSANLLLKLGASVAAPERFLFGILGWQSAAGLAVFGIGGILYALVLRSVPLNLAQVFTSLQFIGVIIAARFVLGEPISPLRWIGILSICVGIMLVAGTARP